MNKPTEETEKKRQKREEKERERERRIRNLKDLSGEAKNLIKEIFTGKAAINKENEYVRQFYRIAEQEKGEKHSRYTVKERVVFIGIILILLNVILLIARYLYAISHLPGRIVSNSFFYILPAGIAPFVLWMYSTNENFWAFHKRKRLFFYLCSVNLALLSYQPIYSLIRKIVVPAVLQIPTNPCLTDKMVMLLAYLGVFFLVAASLALIYSQLEPVLSSPITKRQIELFKLQHILDDRANREYKYDVNAIFSLEEGKPITIKENDRMLQFEINGASGTGKTSTIFCGVILQDLKQKVVNREKRHEEYMRMIVQKKATLQGPLKDFREDAVVAIGKTQKELERNQKELEKIRKTAPDCGMTIVAPNNSLMKDIIRMCEARDIKVNVIDPAASYGQFKNVREVGLNPFFCPLDLEENARVIWISKAANVFSDVLIATNAMTGDVDQYFVDISLSVSYNIACIIMLAKNIKGEQAYISDVIDCITNFDNITPYVQEIESHYGIYVPETKSNTKNDPIMRRESLHNNGIPNAAAQNPINLENAKKNPYYEQLKFVKDELLGGGKEKMFDQARGLRNLVTKTVQDPRIRKMLSATEGNSIDFDKILSENQITVVSTAIELGQSTSTSFGLFFLLLHRTSVLRRPMATRTPHFLWIDECAQYVHPMFDEMIALYRQFRVSTVLTLQSLTQLEKSSSTAYLKNVLLGAGTHIVFGRLAPEEMKLYSEMAGVYRDVEEQKSFSQTSILSDNPSFSESVRATPTITNIMEGSDMRLLDFLELTIFTVDNGRVLPGQHGRVFFIGQDAFDKQKSREYLWEEAVPEAFRENANKIPTPQTMDEEESNATLRDKIPDSEELLIHSETVVENKAEGKDAATETSEEDSESCPGSEEDSYKDMSLADLYNLFSE